MKIRLARPSDAPMIAAIYRPAVLETAISFELEPPDDDEMARRIERILQRTPWLVLDHAGTVLGYAYASPHRERAAYQWAVDVSAYVAAEARRCGVARALYTSLLAALPLQGFRRAYAGIALPNAASVGLHTAVGFTPVGVYHNVGFKLGRWHDVAWFERSLGGEDAPGVIRPLPTIARDPAFTEALASGLRLARVPG